MVQVLYCTYLAILVSNILKFFSINLISRLHLREFDRSNFAFKISKDNIVFMILLVIEGRLFIKTPVAYNVALIVNRF